MLDSRAKARSTWRALVLRSPEMSWLLSVKQKNPVFHSTWCMVLLPTTMALCGLSYLCPIRFSTLEVVQKRCLLIPHNFDQLTSCLPTVVCACVGCEVQLFSMLYRKSRCELETGDNFSFCYLWTLPMWPTKEDAIYLWFLACLKSLQLNHPTKLIFAFFQN